MRLLRQLTFGDYALLALAVAGTAYGCATIVDGLEPQAVETPTVHCDVSDAYNSGVKCETVP